MAPTVQISRRTFLRDCAADRRGHGIAPVVRRARARGLSAGTGGHVAERSAGHRAHRLRRHGPQRCQEREPLRRHRRASATSTRATRPPRPSSSRKTRRFPPSSATSARSSIEGRRHHRQATPDHWHTLINLAAAKAKKDIYAEKPLTLTIDEGKRMVKAVRENRVVLQTGTQQRSHKLFRLACELARNGRIGKLTQVTVFVPAGLREGPFQPRTVPDGFNWDVLARTGAEGGLPQGADAWHVPLVVRLFGRPGHRLGRAPQRRRPLGDRARRSDRHRGARDDRSDSRRLHHAVAVRGHADCGRTASSRS